MRQERAAGGTVLCARRSCVRAAREAAARRRIHRERLPGAAEGASCLRPGRCMPSSTAVLDSKRWRCLRTSRTTGAMALAHLHHDDACGHEAITRHGLCACTPAHGACRHMISAAQEARDPDSPRPWHVSWLTTPCLDAAPRASCVRWWCGWRGAAARLTRWPQR
jgi:hypothetical protein